MPARTSFVDADSAYVITGGLGALGLAVADRFVQRGARHLVLIGRTAPGTAALAALDELRAAGADVRTVAVDVTDGVAVHAALDSVRDGLPPVRGVVHAAGLLADATLDRMDPATLHAALAPKLGGAWNLHLATLDDPLDFFVLFSSVAAVLGLTGQANYAAGNAFLDALAEHRRLAGLPALSVAWGPWAKVGLAAAAANRGDRLAERGLGSLDPDDALDALELLLASDTPPAVSAMRFDAARWSLAQPSSTGFVGGLHAEPETLADRGGLAARLRAVPAGARRRRSAEDAVAAQLAPVLRVAPEKIDRHRELRAMGLDSLMALELRNRLEVETGLTLSATVAWNYPTVTALSAHLATRMGVALEGDAEANDAPPPPVQAAVEHDHSAAASHDDLEALLREELEAVDRLLNADGRAT